MSKNTTDIQSVIEPKIKELGYDIEYTEFVKEGKDYIYRIVIDKKDSSLTTEDCETVSRAVDQLVEEGLKTELPYFLEVSSPGLERELKNIRLYKKYIGSKIRVKLYRKIEDKKEIIGILKDVLEDKIIIEIIEDKVLEIEFKDIACGNTVYDFGEEF